MYKKYILLESYFKIVKTSFRAKLEDLRSDIRVILKQHSYIDGENENLDKKFEEMVQ